MTTATTTNMTITVTVRAATGGCIERSLQNIQDRVGAGCHGQRVV